MTRSRAIRTSSRPVFRPSVRLAGLLLTLLAFVLPWGQSSEARLEPYYIVRGASFASVTPRVLIVLDTSGSMAWEPNSSNMMCDWDDCETSSATRQSRIAAARSAINSLVSSMGDSASFALMTFDQRRPPTSSGQVPSKCGSSTTQRFTWVQWYTDTWNGWDTTNLYGYSGTWRLCGTNRPYPYLRYDNLGVGSKISGNNKTGAVPASPLISTTSSNFSSSSNSTRKVQWFPKFMGTRVQLNSTTDPDREILYSTYGDYGTTNSARNTNVWGRDFYYWPYVDGFPGYSFFVGWEWDYTELGVASEDTSTNSASLYAPFYMGDDLNGYAVQDKGPASEAEARATISSLTSTLMSGGVDVSGGTPWRSVIGPITGSPPSSNAPFAHTTVASYIRFSQNVSAQGLCVPHAAILVTDGDPDPVSTEGGANLHSRLSALRTDLGAKVYVVGFVHASNSLQAMACAAAGSNNTGSPCSGTPVNEWDTCANSASPSTGCAYLASSTSQLAAVLTTIVEGELALDVPSGPSSFMNEFPSSDASSGLQTSLTAYTEWPGWRGHVVRALCTDTDEDDPGTLAEHCVDSGEIEIDEPSFGACAAARSWDAGTCLQQTDWKDRRLYMNDGEGDVFLIANDDGTATNEFLAALNDADLAISGGPYNSVQADAIAAFVLGKNWPQGWKLPGLANSAPVIVRRIPEFDSETQPSVPIRDQHCAGRRLANAEHVPASLEEFAAQSWSDEHGKIADPEDHYEYQEAAIIGDDLGILHAFQLHSGNELWGLLPRHALQSAVLQFGEGANNMGQPQSIDAHHYGIAGTVNQGWIYDDAANDGDGGWRHLLVVPSGIGGKEIMALDVSHMSPYSEKGPVEVLWSTADAELVGDYADLLGETWSRPALTYHVPHDLMSSTPDAYLVFGSGYADGGDDAAGRTVVMANALTGEVVDAVALPEPSASDVYGDDYAAVVDVAVGSHCVSRFWSEAQEAYIADPAGRLFRWDVGRDTEHAADSGEEWNGTAVPLVTFPACAGEGNDCEVDDDNRGEPFFFAPALSAIDRIDDEAEPSGTIDTSRKDQFLIALVSGTIYDDATDGADDNNDLHSSIYLLADDHREDLREGLELPDDFGVTAAGDHASFFRLPLTSITRTRVYQPVAGGDTFEETRKFGRSARPLRGPRIRVTGAYSSEEDEEPLEGVEVFYVEYVIYEPGDQACDSEWFDKSKGEWVFDQGSTYVLRLRLTVNDSAGFDFVNGAGYELEDGYGFSESGLEVGAAQQIRSGECADGVCSPQLGIGSNRPCRGEQSDEVEGGVTTVPLSWSELDGFSPLEINLSE